MNPRRTLFLVIVAAALALYVRQSERVPGRTSGAAGGRVAFPAIPAHLAVSIEWSRDGVALRLERGAEGRWRMTAPVKAPADTAAVDAFLERLAKLRPKAWLSPAEIAGPTVKAFGLEAGAGILKVAADGPPIILKIGGLTPLSGEFYLARVGTEGVFVADASLLDSLPATANDWRDRSIIPAHDSPVDRIEVRGATAFEAAQDAATGLWRLVKPLSARADGAQLTGLLSALARSQIERFVTDAPPADLESLGLQPPQAEVVLAAGTNTIARLSFGRGPTNAPGLVYLWRPDSTNLSLAPAALLARLREPLAAFRDRRLFPPLEGLRQVEITSYGVPSALVRQGTNWTITAPARMPADPTQVDFLMQQLSGLLVEDFPDDVVADFGRYGLTNPVAALRVAWATNLSVEVQFGGRAAADVIYARRVDEPGVYAVRASDFKALPVSTEQLRDLRFVESQAVKLWSRRGQRRRVLERGADGAWRVTEGPPGVLFGPAIDETIHKIGALDFTRGAVPRESLYTELSTYKQMDYEVGVELRAGAPVHSLRFRFVTDNGVAAVALLNADESPRAWQVELPGALLQDIRRDFGIP